jgi:hypothetical protein
VHGQLVPRFYRSAQHDQLTASGTGKLDAVAGGLKKLLPAQHFA